MKCKLQRYKSPASKNFSCEDFVALSASVYMAVSIYPAHAQLQEHAIGMLCDLYGSVLSLKNDIYAAGLQARVVYMALGNHITNCAVIVCCLGVIINIIGDGEEHASSVKLPYDGTHLLAGVIHVMRENEASAPIQEQGCIILFKMAQRTRANRQDIERAGGLKLLTDSMKKFASDAAVLTRVCVALQCLLDDDRICDTITIEWGVECIEILLDVVKQNMQCRAIQTSCMDTLFSMSNTMRQEMADMYSITTTVLLVSTHYIDSIEMQHACFDVLANIAGDSAFQQEAIHKARKSAISMTLFGNRM